MLQMFEVFPSKFAQELRDSAERQELVRVLDQHVTTQFHLLRAARLYEQMARIKELFLSGSPEGFALMDGFIERLEAEQDGFCFPPRTMPDGSLISGHRCRDKSNERDYLRSVWDRFHTWLRMSYFWPAIEQRAERHEQANPDYAKKLREA